jgi:beta-lactamase superfamily II metal-dependent hydrolase
VNSLDGLVLAHGSTRRLGGAITLLDDFRPRRIAESVLGDRSPAHKRFEAELARRGRGKGLYERGDFIRVSDSLALRVLYPPAGLKRSAADDKALVFQLDCNGARALCMSDSGFATEQWLMENEPDLRGDLLIKGQHSKDFSGTLDFLSRVRPQAILCGATPFGQPSERLDEWERDVTQEGIAVFRQDHSGAVGVIMKEGRFEARAFLNGQTFFSRAR